MLFGRGSTDLVLIWGKSHAVLRGASPDCGSWSKWDYSSLGSRSLFLGHSVLPLPCENGRFSMGFCRDIYFSSSSIIQMVYMGLSTGVYLTSTTAGRNVRESFSPGSTKSSACSPTCRGIFLSWYYRVHLAAPPKRHCIAPYSRIYSRLSPSKAAALTRHYRPPLRTRQQQRWQRPYSLITIDLQYITRHKWRSCNKFGVTDTLFSVPTARVGPILEGQAPRASKDYCPPQYYNSAAYLPCTQQ